VFAFEIDKTIDIDFIEGNAPDGITEDNACEECGIEAHRDAVGALNIGLAEGLDVPSEVINRAMTRPEVVS